MAWLHATSTTPVGAWQAITHAYAWNANGQLIARTITPDIWIITLKVMVVGRLGAVVRSVDNNEVTMNGYKSLDELMASISSLDKGEWVYVNIKAWGDDPFNAGFYYIPWDYIQTLEDDEIYLDEEDMEMPLVVKELNLKTWMLIGSLAYISKIKNDNGFDNQWVVDEVNYYREFDTFRT
jgi:hypothetical protein